MMGGSNRVEPLRKSEKELKRRPLSFMAGAQSKKHIWLRNDTKNKLKKGESGLTLEGLTLVASWLEFVAP